MRRPKRVANALVALAILSPAVSGAHTIAKVQSQPNGLLEQIVDLMPHFRRQLSQSEDGLKRQNPHASNSTSIQPATFFMGTGQAQTVPAPSTISVMTSVDGKSVHQGHAITISWRTGNAPAGSAVALFPEKAVTGLLFAPIATSLPTSGSYTWQVPIFVMQPIPCARDITGGCVGSMNPGTSYKIVARLYTPATASFVEFGPTKPYPTVLATGESGEFTMLSAP
jgi:hypothetical protein